MHYDNFYGHGVGGGVELNVSSSGKYALALGQFLSEVGAFNYSLGISLTLCNSIGCNVGLYASAKVRDTQCCKLGAKVLKSFCAPWQLNLHTKRGWEEKLGCGVMDSPRTQIVVYK